MMQVPADVAANLENLRLFGNVAVDDVHQEQTAIRTLQITGRTIRWIGSAPEIVQFCGARGTTQNFAKATACASKVFPPIVHDARYHVNRDRQVPPNLEYPRERRTEPRCESDTRLARRLPRDDHRVLTSRIARNADQSLLQTDRFGDREVSADQRGDLLEAVLALVHVGDWNVPLRVLRRAQYEDAAGREDAVQFRDEPFFVVHVLDRLHRQHRVESSLVEAGRGAVDDMVEDVAVGGRGARLGDGPGVHVAAMSLANRSGDRPHAVAGAARELEHLHPGRQMPEP